MADFEGGFQEPSPPVVYDYIPTLGNSRPQQHPINRKVPDIMYDDRTIYRQEYDGIKPPYSPELPWKPDNYKPEQISARGIIPGFYGPKYTNPYALLQSDQLKPAYESSGAQRQKDVLAKEMARQRAHDRAIPLPPVRLENLTPIENLTEYRSMLCKTITTEDGTEIPDVKPMDKSLYKYYLNENKFSYNSQHNNPAY